MNVIKTMNQDTIAILCSISTIVFSVCVANIIVRIPMLIAAIIDREREKVKKGESNKANKAKKGGP